MHCQNSKRTNWQKLPTGKFVEVVSNEIADSIHAPSQADGNDMLTGDVNYYQEFISTNSEENTSIKFNLSNEDVIQRLKRLELKEDLNRNEQLKLTARLENAELQLEEQLGYITFLEKEVSRLDQYGRRENIEIIGIPSRIPDRYLESEVINILKKIGLKHINSYSIVGCHRIGKPNLSGCRNTIVRFLHRKDAINCLSKKKYLYLCRDLGYDSLSIMENLCPSYKSIYEDLKELKRIGSISKFWTFNGSIKYKKNDNEDELPTKVLHQSELDDFFYNEGVP